MVGQTRSEPGRPAVHESRLHLPFVSAFNLQVLHTMHIVMLLSANFPLPSATATHILSLMFYTILHNINRTHGVNDAIRPNAGFLEIPCYHIEDLIMPFKPIVIFVLDSENSISGTPLNGRGMEKSGVRIPPSKPLDP
ncbi:hypothetical protein RJT34_22808 [Clitoria ternatea]|uniref:Uncharacterized protein n=1 Tax=Clitoria ternatea TaxID=43366 RepID=A0AAN9FMB5_CLITE